MASIVIKNNLSLFLSKYSRHTRNFGNSFLLRSTKVPEEALPKNLLEEYICSHKQPYGKIYDKRPFKITLIANKLYAWCSCGESKSQPLCDKTHKIHSLEIKNKPIYFKVNETKDYWLCNCKQSEHRPFCDGAHKKEEIQSALKNFKM